MASARRPAAHHPTDGVLGGIQAALRIQGAAHVWGYGAANLAGFALAAVILVIMMKRTAGPGAWLVYNWALHASLFVFLFPWLGGYP